MSLYSMKGSSNDFLEVCLEPKMPEACFLFAFWVWIGNCD